MAQAAQRGTAPVNGTSSSSATATANAGGGGGATAAPTATSNKDIPRDARIIGLILASLGVTDAEPGVVAMLLEFAHRYTLEVLQDAQVYAEHAQRPRDPSAQANASPLEVDDLRMAVSSKLEHSYSSPLPKEFLLPLAAQINRVPLPILPESYGIRLPHERDRLTAVNWDLARVTEKRTYPQQEQLNQAQNGLDAQHNQAGTQASTSTSQQQGLNGTAVAGGAAASGTGMELDMAGNDLFGGNDDEDDEDDDDDDDDDDDEDMEEVVDTSLQPDQSSKDAEDAEGNAEEDGDDDDAEEDDDDDDGNADEDDDDDEDGEGHDDT